MKHLSEISLGFLVMLWATCLSPAVVVKGEDHVHGDGLISKTRTSGEEGILLRTIRSLPTNDDNSDSDEEIQEIEEQVEDMIRDADDRHGSDDWLEYVKMQPNLFGRRIIVKGVRSVNSEGRVKCDGCSKVGFFIHVGPKSKVNYSFRKSNDNMKPYFDSMCLQTDKYGRECPDDDPIVSNVNIECSKASRSVKSESIFPQINACSIDGFTYRSCTNKKKTIERLHFVIASDKIYLSRSLKLRKIYDFNDPDQYNTSKECRKLCFKSNECSGDSAYKQYFPMTGRPLASECHVELDSSKPVFVAYNRETDREEPVACYGEGSFVVERKSDDDSNGDQLSKSDVTVECDDGRVLAVSKTLNIDLYKFCSGFRCFSDSNRGKKLEINLPLSMQTSSLKGVLTLQSGTSEKIQIDVNCDGTDLCSKLDCTICFIALMNPKCYKAVHYVILTMLIVLLACILILVISALNGLWMLLRLTASIVGMSHKLVGYVTQKIWRAVRRRRLVEVDDVEAGLEEVRLIDRPNMHEIRERLNRRLNNPVLLLSLLCLIVVVDCQSCVSHTYIESNEVSCKREKGSVDRICKVNKILEVDMFPHSVDSCVSLKDKNGAVVKSLAFGLEEVIEECQRTHGYYSTNAEFHIHSITHCPISSECSKDICASYKPDSKMPFVSDSNNHVGVSGCEASCGTLMCGCFPGGDSCVIYRHFLLPKVHDPHTVEICSSWRKTFRVSMKVIGSGEKTVSKDVKLSLGNRVLADPSVTLSINGGSSIITTETRESFVGMDSGKYLCTDVNDEGDFDNSKFGFVQCPTEESAANLGVACKTSKDVFDHMVFGKTISDRSKAIDYDMWKKEKCSRLPFTRDNYLFDWDDQGYHRHEVTGSLYKLVVEMEDFEISEDVDDVTCEMKFVSLKGCYSCEMGADVSVLVSASADHTLIHLDCNDGSVTSISADADTKTLKFKMSFKSARVDTECEVTCGDHKSKMKMVGDLEYVGSTKQSYQGGVVEYAKTDGMGLMSVFPSLFTGIHSYIGILMMLFAIVLVVVIMKAVIGVFSSSYRLLSSKEM